MLIFHSYVELPDSNLGFESYLVYLFQVFPKDLQIPGFIKPGGPRNARTSGVEFFGKIIEGSNWEF
jgi:hypothetical protein